MNTSLEILGRFAFNADGFDIAYTYNVQTTHLQLYPGALCQLLTEAGLIEDFMLDCNAEPVILFAGNAYPPALTAGTLLTAPFPFRTAWPLS